MIAAEPQIAFEIAEDGAPRSGGQPGFSGDVVGDILSSAVPRDLFQAAHTGAATVEDPSHRVDVNTRGFLYAAGARDQSELQRIARARASDQTAFGGEV